MKTVCVASEIFSKYFRKWWKFHKIHKIKDPQKFSAIRYAGLSTEPVNAGLTILETLTESLVV